MRSSLHSRQERDRHAVSFGSRASHSFSLIAMVDPDSMQDRFWPFDLPNNLAEARRFGRGS